METVTHPLAPIFSQESHTLILGTMPSPKSRERGYYYAHPQNRFWPALAAVYGVPAPTSDAERRALVTDNGLALWDVLESCTITGAADASIRNPVANHIAELIAQTRITRVFTTGITAARLYQKLVEPDTRLACVILPSPSAANAAMSLPVLIERYRSALLGL